VEWIKQQEKAIQMIKIGNSMEVLLAYPNFTKEFHIHTDANKTQLGAVISQEGKSMAHSKKLSPAQPSYTTTEREPLAIVETLKEFTKYLTGTADCCLY